MEIYIDLENLLKEKILTKIKSVPPVNYNVHS